MNSILCAINHALIVASPLDTKHPHDCVSPDVSFPVATSVLLPQSH